MFSQKERELFGERASILKKTTDETEYQIECDTSNSSMYCYHLFPGIDLSYTTFYANCCFKRQQSLPHVLQISYCKAGLYECDYKRGFITYVGEGDLAIGTMSTHREEPVFPTGFYDGIAIIIDMKVTGEYFSNLVEGISINLGTLVQKFCEDRCCTVIKASPELLGVFNELYNLKNREYLGYMRLKVLEIFFLLSQLYPQENKNIEVSQYFSSNLIKKIKALKVELLNNLDTKMSLKDLSERYDLSLTMMKDCFKAIYGKPIHAFQREYKMRVATKLLVTTSLSISEIAGRLGYENPNKFSTAFKSIIGLSPREYRAKN